MRKSRRKRFLSKKKVPMKRLCLMRRRRVKIRVKIIVLETVPLQIEKRRRRLKFRVKIWSFK
jgi:hypothetical protein